MLIFEDLLHLLVRILFLHLKENISHQKSENQCWTCQVLVASEIWDIKLKPIRLGPCENMWLKLGQSRKSLIEISS